MLNGRHDRETGPCTDGSAAMSAVDVVEKVTAALNQGRLDEPAAARRAPLPPSAYVNVLVVPREDGDFPVDEAALWAMGVRVVRVATDGTGCGRYEIKAVVRELYERAEMGMVRAIAEEHGRFDAFTSQGG